MSNKNKYGSIKTKLIWTMIPIMAISVLSIMIINFVNMKKTVTNSTYMNMNAESNANVKEIEKWAENILTSLDSVKNTLSSVTFSTEEEQHDFLRTTINLNSSFPNGVYMGNETGFYMDGSGWKPDRNYIVKEREWYKEGLTHENFEFGNPYVDADSGNLVVSASTLLEGSGDHKTVIATDVLLDDITEMVSEITFMGSDTGFAFLVDANSSTILAHKDKSLNAQLINEMEPGSLLAEVSKLIQKQDYSINTIKDGHEDYFVLTQPVEGTSWMLVSCVAEGEVFGDLNRMLFIYVAIAIVVILLVAIIIDRIIGYTILPIKKLTEGITQITDGDFTVAINPKGNDEIAVMSTALKKYIETMNNIIKSIRIISSNLDDKAGISKRVSGVLSNTAKEQSQSMRNMEASIDQLANAVSELAKNASMLAQVVNTANEHGDKVNEKIEVSVAATENGFKGMQKVQVTMEDIVLSIKELSKSVESVSESTKEINGIVALIEDIASQTNLLSLNASIEAARAGEAGRGFAVVASEIGHLADISSKSTHQISEIIEKVNVQIGDMVNKTKHSVESIEENSVSINQACDIFEHIYTDINNTKDLIQSILSEIQQVDDVASSMAVISEQQSASAEEILATIEVLTINSAQVEDESYQVEECSTVVAESSEELAEHMKQFKIKED